MGLAPDGTSENITSRNRRQSDSRELRMPPPVSVSPIGERVAVLEAVITDMRGDITDMRREISDSVAVMERVERTLYQKKGAEKLVFGALEWVKIILGGGLGALLTHWYSK